MIRSCGNRNRQDKILPVCLFLRIGSIRAAVCVERHSIGVDLPYRIKCHALIGSVTASRLIGCRCCRRSGCPTPESVTVPRGDCGSQNQCDILGLGLTCRGVTTTIDIVLYLISFGDITPDGIKRCACLVGIAVARSILRHGCCSACRPTEEGIAGSRRLRACNRQWNIVSFGLTCRCIGTAVRIIPNGVGFGIVLPHCIQRYIGVVRVTATGCVTCGGGISVFRPTDKAVICSRRNGGCQCQCHTVSLGLT